MKTILVPVDFSEYSEYALEVAASIARDQDAKIVVVHMMELPESHLTQDEQQEAFSTIYYMKLAKEKFRKFLNKDYLKDIEITQAVKNHKVFSELTDVAREHKASLIVMGSKGVTGLKEIFIGSNTEKVVRTSEVPVLVIKNRLSKFKINKAVVITDFSEESAESYKKARDFFQKFNVEPQLLYVNVPEKFLSTGEMEVEAKGFLSKINGGDNRPKQKIIFYNDYNLEMGVFHYCENAGIDIIGLSTHGRKGIAHFFYGSVGEDIANHADVPVVTFKL